MSERPPERVTTGGTEADVSYRLQVNGTDHDVANAWLGESLLYVLRERLGLPGSKNACEQGECGSCSVLVDGRLVCSCLVLSAAAVDREIITVEGITEESGAPSLVQQAWKRTNFPSIHGWVYDLRTGRLKDLACLRPGAQLDEIYMYDLGDSEEQGGESLREHDHSTSSQGH